jgi:ribosome biogenesis protein Nip4
MIASMINNRHDKKHKSKYAKKVLIILDEKYKHDESFLKLGPIKSIKYLGGKSININMELDNFEKIVKQFTNIENPQVKHFNINNREHCSLFFANSIKILLYIYKRKIIKIEEKEYKSIFIDNLKQIHIGITIDNIEYLESTELIEKENTNGYIIINVRHKHTFIKNLIDLNFNYFLRNNLIHNFLERSGY